MVICKHQIKINITKTNKNILANLYRHLSMISMTRTSKTILLIRRKKGDNHGILCGNWNPICDPCNVGLARQKEACSAGGRGAVNVILILSMRAMVMLSWRFDCYLLVGHGDLAWGWSFRGRWLSLHRCSLCFDNGFPSAWSLAL